jgi:hypothetical protein
MGVLNIAADKRKHFGVGLLILVYLVVVCRIAAFSAPLAVAIGGTVACGFVEWYQRARGNGAAEWGDLLAGALPCWVAALVWWRWA